MEFFNDATVSYKGRYITNVKQTPTPIWMKRRLTLCGLRSIHVLVDITNYVLLETGQPLHAFDAEKSGALFSVEAFDDERPCQTLDAQDRTIPPQVHFICNDNQPVAIAGVMGAANTEVDASTTSIFLESAYFNPTYVRKNAQACGLRTDSSARFEKGVTMESVNLGSARACELYQQLVNADISDLVCESISEPSLPKPKNIPFSIEQINKFLGSSFSKETIEKTLIALGFVINDSIACVPAWRHHDIQEWPCLAEEVGRLCGFDQIPSTLPATTMVQDEILPIVKLTDEMKSFWVSNGFMETVTYPMISKHNFSLRKYDTMKTT